VAVRDREPNPDRVLSTRRIYEGRKASLRVDTIELEAGRISEREIIEHGAVSAVVPLDSDGCIVMVRQYRLAAEDVLLEIPAGMIDDGETPEQAAMRELAEEAGLGAGKLTRISGFYPTPGISTEVIYLFLAEDLCSASAEADEDEDIVVQKVPLSTAVLMAEKGEFRDAKTIVGVLLAATLRGLLR
jgi:ADP-ribose pyrophosphatase